MTDSRAALEEAAEKFWQETARSARGNILPITALFADFAEQESSSLKLLLRAICRGILWLPLTGGVSVKLGPEATWFDCQLDSSGIPVLTQEIIEALKNAAIF